jgi:hypothetical protein
MIITGSNIRGANFYGQATAPGNFELTYFIVGGGGGGGQRGGGGGGAGGIRTSTLSLPPAPRTININIGAGGAGSQGTSPGSTAFGVNGNPTEVFTPNAFFSPISTLGGGGGGGRTVGPVPVTNPATGSPPGYAWGRGSPGGSGGGSMAFGTTTQPPAGNVNSVGEGTPGQGFPGGQGALVNYPIWSLSGGGGGGNQGAGGAGVNADSVPNARTGGGGGLAYTWPVTGLSYAGGGGGGAGAVPPGPTTTNKTGGGLSGFAGLPGPATTPGYPGSGGTSSWNPPTGPVAGFSGVSSTANFGGGGGGGGQIYRNPLTGSFYAQGGSGGSGVAVIQYPGGTVRGTFSPAPQVVTDNPGAYVRHTINGSVVWSFV